MRTLSIADIYRIYRAATGSWPQAVDCLDRHTFQIETPIAGAADVGQGFVEVFLQHVENGWLLTDDGQYLRTAQRCGIEVFLPPGVVMHEGVVRVETGPDREHLVAGLRLLCFTLRGLHEPAAGSASVADLPGSRLGFGGHGDPKTLDLADS